jgi:AcrR family transcriptional regulator
MARVRSSYEDAGFPGAQRLRGEDRRVALVDAAIELAEQGVDAISMESVAAHAGVSRPLVYKHFGNRDELLAAVFRQTSRELDASIYTAVEQASGFEGKTRAWVRAVLEAVSSRDSILVPLLRAGARDAAFRREQRERDRRTVRFVARLAVKEFRLDERAAKAATAMLLSAIDSILMQWRAHPTPEQAQYLEDIYLDLVLGGLHRLAQHRPASA